MVHFSRMFKRSSERPFLAQSRHAQWVCADRFYRLHPWWRICPNDEPLFQRQLEVQAYEVALANSKRGATQSTVAKLLRDAPSICSSKDIEDLEPTGGDQRATENGTPIWGTMINQSQCLQDLMHLQH